MPAEKSKRGPRGREELTIANLKAFAKDLHQKATALEVALNAADAKGVTRLMVGNVKTGSDGLEYLASFIAKIYQAVLEYDLFKAAGLDGPQSGVEQGTQSAAHTGKRSKK